MKRVTSVQRGAVVQAALDLLQAALSHGKHRRRALTVHADALKHALGEERIYLPRVCLETKHHTKRRA